MNRSRSQVPDLGRSAEESRPSRDDRLLSGLVVVESSLTVGISRLHSNFSAQPGRPMRRIGVPNEQTGTRPPGGMRRGVLTKQAWAIGISLTLAFLRPSRVGRILSLRPRGRTGSPVSQSLRHATDQSREGVVASTQHIRRRPSLIRSQWLPRIGISLVAALTMQTMAAIPALAFGPDAANCSARTSHSAGAEAYVSGQQKHGASGTIEGQNLDQCTNPAGIQTSGTFAWSALEDGGTGNSGGAVILQIGIGKCRDFGNFGCGSDMRYLWAWGRDSTAPGCAGWSHIDPVPNSVGTWDGAAHDFKVYHQNNYYRFFIGANQVASVAERSICWTPTRAQWFSETWDDGDALGGSAGNPLVTSSTNYANAENGGFFWTSLSAPCRFPGDSLRHCSIVSPTSLKTWTER